MGSSSSALSPSLAAMLALAVGGLSMLAIACSSDDASDASTTPTTTGGTATVDGGPGGPGGEGGTGPGADGGTGPGADGGGSSMADLQKRKAQMLTSFWENDTTVFQYAFARNNNDGYGYTSGRVGFTTATGDTADVVKCFDAAFTGGGNLMKKYEAALLALQKKQQDTGNPQPSTSTLDAIGNFTADWTATANNAATAPAFDKCQDDLVDSIYWAPTLPIMTKWGLTSALARASLYDAFVVHGESNVNNLASQTNGDTGNGAQKPATAPLSQAAESTWLEAFHLRRVALLNSSGAWRGAIARGALYEQQRRDGNFDFSQNITTDATASVVFPGKGYPSNGYQTCVIHPDGSVTGDPACTAPTSN
jgi:chitosanase